MGAHSAAGGRRWIVVVAVILVGAVLAGGAFALMQPPKPPRFTPEPGPGVFRGFGTWVDIFEEAVWQNPEAAVAAMDARGITTVYLQASNYAREEAIVYPEATGRFIDAAHERGMHVVGWDFPGYEDGDADLARALEAIEFRSEGGQGYDGFGIDMEPGLERDPAARTEALLKLSRRIRAEVGPDYPLGAVSPNPMRIKNESTYWPGFPYQELSRIYDAFLPMDYFGAVGEAANKRGAFRYTLEGIREIREGSERLGVPIHVIGGLAEDITPPELEGFLRAVDKGQAVGYSLYTYSTTGDADWVLLEAAAEAGLTEGVGLTPSQSSSLTPLPASGAEPPPEF